MAGEECLFPPGRHDLAGGVTVEPDATFLAAVLMDAGQCRLGAEI